MGDEWIEIAALWKPRTEGSRLVCKGKATVDVKAGEKVLVMVNQYATEDNRQPQFRLMVVREDGDRHIDLQTGENVDREPDWDSRIDDSEQNPHEMG